MRERKALLVILLTLVPACSSDDRLPRTGSACSGQESGGDVGDLAPDFALINQQGEIVLLSDYCGAPVLLQMGAMWCPGCQRAAQQIPSRLEEHPDLVLLNLMAETPSGSPPSARELESWANTFDLNSPVLADTSWNVWDHYVKERTTPRSVLLDREGRITAIDYSISDQQIEEVD